MLFAASVAGLATVAPAIAIAQPVDPYGPETPQQDPQPPGAVIGDRDPEVDEAIAASLVVRARQLMSIEEWADAQQLLGEAVMQHPDGAAAAEAKELLEQVNVKLGIVTKVDAPPIDPYVEPIGPGDGDLGGPIDPGLPPDVDQPRNRAGRKFLLHAAAIGATFGGFVGDAASADIQPIEVDGDPVGAKDSTGALYGVLFGGLGGLAIGAGFRNSPWMTRDDIIVIDSFAAAGMLASLSLAGVMNPEFSEAYSVNAAIGTAAGAVTGYVVAKRKDLSARRIGRVDLWAATGALVPWTIFALAKGDRDGAQVAGFFSLAGLAGGAWLGFRLTRHWDDHDSGAAADAPMALIRRSSDGMWSMGAPGVTPVPGGATVDVLGARW
jgi:hypothetical protein